MFSWLSLAQHNSLRRAEKNTVGDFYGLFHLTPPGGGDRIPMDVLTDREHIIFPIQCFLTAHMNQIRHLACHTRRERIATLINVFHWLTCRLYGYELLTDASPELGLKKSSTISSLLVWQRCHQGKTWMWFKGYGMHPYTITKTMCIDRGTGNCGWHHFPLIL